MKVRRFGIIFAFLSGPLLYAQAGPGQARAILDHTLQSRKVVTFQLQEYLLKRAPKLPKPASASEWTAEAEKIRKHLVDDVVFHGWPKAWVDSPPQFQDLGTIPSVPGYTLTKLRYEVVPGFYSTAILYAPSQMEGRVPAVLNVMGHFDLGKAMPFEQKLCINLALHGMMALNLDWIGMGELNSKQDDHWYQADLDLVGANGVGLFYLAMRRGLDYLAANPHVDSRRLGVTGLSGGGWQTIVLSALDDRVDVSIPVAGYNTLAGSIGRMPLAPSEPGDFEQESTDFRFGQGYNTLTAMRAPRPTLLINNAEDSCCYRAPLAKPNIYDPIKPFYALYGKSEAFKFHENTDPSTHNYGLDNRQHAYRFFTRWFGLPAAEREIPVDSYVKTYDQLAVGVPKNNQTILGLARKFRSEITRTPIPTGSGRAGWAAADRAKLKSVVRYHPVEVREAWREGNTKDKMVESLWYRFELSNGLGATGIWTKGIVIPDDAPLVVVLDDKGKKAAGKESWNRMPWIMSLVNSGNQVLVLDLVFTGEASPDQSGVFFADMLASTGMRPLGLEAAQLLALTGWAQKQWKPREVRLETAGIRSQVEGLVAAALAPRMFSQVVTHAGMEDLGYLLDEPVKYTEAPDLFCLDLYKDFDLNRLAAIAVPTQVAMLQNLKASPKPEAEAAK